MGSLNQQAFEAKEAGIAEIVKMLQHPDDLARLPELRAEYAQRVKTSKATLAAVVQAQVEAARVGMDLLQRANRASSRLRDALEKINSLCRECQSLIDNHEKIRQLNAAQQNIEKVLLEIGDIIDLPSRAEVVAAMMDDDSQLLPAFEGLVVLEGTSNNAKYAYLKSKRKLEAAEATAKPSSKSAAAAAATAAATAAAAKGGKAGGAASAAGGAGAAASDNSNNLFVYLEKVQEVLEAFEAKLWRHVRNFSELAHSNPSLLISIIVIIEMQEKVDRQIEDARIENSVRPKHYKERALREIGASVEKQFSGLRSRVALFGRPNTTVRTDPVGNVVVSESYSADGVLTDVVRRSAGGGEPLPPPPPGELATLLITSKQVFSEDVFIDELLDEMDKAASTLSDVYDIVAPCFPPSWSIFEFVQQHTHLSFAAALDALALKVSSLSNKNVLKTLHWVNAYQEALRGLGVEEEVIPFPLAPGSNGEALGGRPGHVAILAAYCRRMEESVSSWMRNIIDADMRQPPKQAADGTLRTPGAVDFFRILNEQVGIIEQVGHGEVLFNTGETAVKLMGDYQEAQMALLKRPDVDLDRLCAILNNGVDCYDKALDFADHVKGIMDPDMRARFNIEEACRGFLDVSKSAMSCLLSLVFSDPGLDLFLRGLYVSPDWRAGATMGTILATINDYFADMQTFVDATFVKRLAEGLLEELVKRMLHTMVANVQSSSPAINTAFVHRLEADEVAVSQAFCAMPGLKPERVVKYLQQLQDLRELMSADSLESFVLCYSNMLEVVSLPPEVLQKVVAQRPDMSRSDAAEVISQCKEIYKQRAKRDAAAKPVEKPLTFMQRVFASATTSAPPAPAAPTAAPPKTPANGLS